MKLSAPNKVAAVYSSLVHITTSADVRNGMIVHMKVLFICQANVGRSQAAMELYRQNGGTADSAGTKVDTPGMTLAERPGAAHIVQIIREEYGIDMIHNKRTQLTEELATDYDRLIVMAEPETWPDWIANDQRKVYWEIDDPKGQDIPTTRRIVHQVKDRVDSLQ